MIEVGGICLPWPGFFDKYGDNILGFGKKSRDESLKYVTNFDGCVDIGAHVGISVLQWAPLFKQVTGFEPMVDHYDCLVKNTAHLSNVTVHNCAMSNESQMLKGAYRTMKNSGSFQLVDEDFVATNHKKTKIYDIPSRRLDEFEFDSIGLIKIDVEGWEFEVLKGAKETIKKHQPVLMIEFTHGGGRENKSMHSYNVDEYYAFVDELGYQQVAEVDGDTIYVPK